MATLSIMALCLLSSCISIASVQAHSGDLLFAIYRSTSPTIDGIIDIGEWTGTTEMYYVINTIGEPVFTVTFYIQQDGLRLYIAFDMPDEWYDSKDETIVRIDTGHDGGFAPQLDDRKYAINRDGKTSRYVGTGTEWASESSTDWFVSSANVSGGWQAEFSFNYSEIEVMVGEPKTVGLHLKTWDEVPGYYSGVGRWPGYDEDKPGTWADLSHYDWIPEFPTWTSMLLVLIVLTAAITIYKRRLLKTPIH